MRIGVAGTDKQQEENWIMDEINERGHDGVFIEPSKVSYVYETGELDIRYEGESLADLDVLFIRRTRFNLEASRDLVAALDALDVRTIERKDVFYNPLSKFNSLLTFVGEELDGVDVPATGIVRTDDAVTPVAERVGFPLIVKPIQGREGEGVQKADTEDDLAEILQDEEFPVLLQEYLDIKEEYRILVVGDEALGTVIKQADDDGVAKNYAQGAEFVPKDRPELEDAAEDIAQIMGIELAGVDIAETTDGRHFEIECNRCPQFKGFKSAHPDVDVAAKIVDYIEEQAR